MPPSLIYLPIKIHIDNYMWIYTNILSTELHTLEYNYIDKSAHTQPLKFNGLSGIIIKFKSIQIQIFQLLTQNKSKHSPNAH